MRTSGLVALIIAVGVVGVSLAASTAAGRKAVHQRALLIGISQYDAYPHHPSLYPSPLHCSNDIRAIEKLLTGGKFGGNWQVTTLTTPRQTTRASILAALDRLVQETGPGDVVFLQYSGHGGTTQDPRDPTGFDETIVPSDYQTTDVDKTHTNEIRSKEIALKLAALRAKHPANVTLVFDCCHSGRISRGQTVVRGISFATLWSKLHPDRPMPGFGRSTRGSATAVKAGSEIDRDADQDNYVVLSACTQGQTAAEDDSDPNAPMGRLTASLVRTLRGAGPTTTYRQIYERIRADFAAHYTDHDQDPQVTGALDNVFLSGTAIAPQEYVPARLDPSSGQLVLTEGEVMGVTPGSKYALYPIGTANFKTAKPLGEAVVDYVGSSSATLKLLGGAAAKLFENGAQAVETDHVYGDLRLTVDGGSIDRLGAEGQNIRKALSGLQLVKLVPSSARPAVAVLPAEMASRGGGLRLVRADASDELIQEFSPGPGLADKLKDALRREAQYRRVKRLANQSDAYCVDVRIVRVSVKPTGQKSAGGKPIYVEDAELPYQAGEPLSVGDWICIKVKNTGTADVHVAVLDIGSDGVVTPIWPGPNAQEDENVLRYQEKPGWVYLWNTAAPSDNKDNHNLIHVTSPDRGEFLKVFATKDYIPFYKFKTQPADSRGESSPFQDLLASTVDDGTRGMSGDQPVGVSEWSTLMLPVVVVDRRRPAHSATGH